MSLTISTASMLLWGYGFILTVSLFFAVWLFAERTKNGGIVDIFWGLGFALVSLLYFVLDFCRYQHPLVASKVLLLLMVGAWSLRLAFYLLMRFMRLYPEEDGRYLAFRKAWGAKASQGMLLAFELQAVLLASLCLPFALVMADMQKTAPGPLQYVALAIFVLALTGEGVSDWQLERFKKDPANRGKVCQIGLWQYSRHPNYFCEWLVWVAFVIYVLDYPGGIFAIYCPAMMYFFLTRVTGIKATEEQALRTKGDAYKKYQETTPAFFPWSK